MERDIAGAWRQQRASEIWPSDVLLRLWPQHKVLLGLQVHIFHMCECMHLHPDKGCCLPAYIWTIASRQTRLKTMMGGMLTEFTFYCPMGTSLLVRSCLQVCSPARTKHRSAYNLHCVLFFLPFCVKVCRYLRAELSKMPVVVIQPAGYLHCVLSLALSSLSHLCIFAILLPSVLYLVHVRSVPVAARARTRALTLTNTNMITHKCTHRRNWKSEEAARGLVKIPGLVHLHIPGAFVLQID